MTITQSSIPPQYLIDQTSFRESLGQLTAANTLSVNSQGNLVPAARINNLFTGSVTTNSRLVELKIMEFLVHGKKWLKPDDIKLVEQLASKAGLFLEKENSTHSHKELRLLINLISKEVLQKETVSPNDYANLCKAFQTHYRKILAPYSKQCEQIMKNFADMIKLQNENKEETNDSVGDETPSNSNSKDTEQQEQNETKRSLFDKEERLIENNSRRDALLEKNRLEAVSSFVIPGSKQTNHDDKNPDTSFNTLPASKEVLAKPTPAIRRTRKTVNSYEENKKLVAKAALGTIAAVATVSTLYYAFKNGNPKDINTIIDTNTPIDGSINHYFVGLIGTGALALVGSAFMYLRSDDTQPKAGNNDPQGGLQPTSGIGPQGGLQPISGIGPQDGLQPISSDDPQDGKRKPDIKLSSSSSASSDETKRQKGNLGEIKSSSSSSSSSSVSGDDETKGYEKTKSGEIKSSSSSASCDEIKDPEKAKSGEKNSSSTSASNEETHDEVNKKEIEEQQIKSTKQIQDNEIELKHEGQVEIKIEQQLGSQTEQFKSLIDVINQTSSTEQKPGTAEQQQIEKVETEEKTIGQSTIQKDQPQTIQIEQNLQSNNEQSPIAKTEATAENVIIQPVVQTEQQPIAKTEETAENVIVQPIVQTEQQQPNQIEQNLQSNTEQSPIVNYQQQSEADKGMPYILPSSREEAEDNVMVQPTMNTLVHPEGIKDKSSVSSRSSSSSNEEQKYAAEKALKPLQESDFKETLINENDEKKSNPILGIKEEEPAQETNKTINAQPKLEGSQTSDIHENSLNHAVTDLLKDLALADQEGKIIEHPVIQTSLLNPNPEFMVEEKKEVVVSGFNNGRSTSHHDFLNKNAKEISDLLKYYTLDELYVLRDFSNKSQLDGDNLSAEKLVPQTPNTYKRSVSDATEDHSEYKKMFKIYRSEFTGWSEVLNNNKVLIPSINKKIQELEDIFNGHHDMEKKALKLQNDEKIFKKPFNRTSPYKPNKKSTVEQKINIEIEKDQSKDEYKNFKSYLNFLADDFTAADVKNSLDKFLLNELNVFKRYFDQTPKERSYKQRPVDYTPSILDKKREYTMGDLTDLTNAFKEVEDQWKPVFIKFDHCFEDYVNQLIIKKEKEDIKTRKMEKVQKKLNLNDRVDTSSEEDSNVDTSSEDQEYQNFFDNQLESKK